MLILVKNCNDCPFCNNDNEYGYSCNFPGSQVEDFEMTGYNEKEMPVKCPLLSGTATVMKDE